MRSILTNYDPIRPCRGYDCRKVQRIWADFEEKIVSPDLQKQLQGLDGMEVGESPEAY